MVPADPLSPLRHFPQPYRTFSRFPADPSTGPLALSNAVAIIYRPVGFRSSPLRRLSACLAVSNAVDNSAGRAGLSFSLPRPSPTLLRVPLDPSASRFHLAHIRFISAPSGTLPRLRSDLLLHSQTLLVPSTRLNAPCRKRRSLRKETRTCVCIRPRPPARAPQHARPSCLIAAAARIGFVRLVQHRLHDKTSESTFTPLGHPFSR